VRMACCMRGFTLDPVDWEAEPDIEELKRSHALLATNPDQAIKNLEILVSRGSIMSAWYLGEFYEHGEYASKDIDKAIKWYTQAETMGWPHASYMLGHIYMSARKYDEAFASFSRGSAKKYSPATYRLAKMYRDGISVDVDFNKYCELLTLAASNKHVYAKRELINLYLFGRFGKLSIIRGSILWLSLLWDLILMPKSMDKNKLNQRFIR
jgi:TPR repeat protein